MLNWLIRRKLVAFEKQYGYDTGYVRELIAVDRAAVFAMGKLGGIAQYRKGAPVDLYYAAKLTAVMAEDCGPCTQLCVAMALEAGVDARVVAAVVEGSDVGMTKEARLGVAFARATIAHDIAADELREQIIASWGQRAIISLAFGIAAARVYPTIKYALGHGKACTRIVVAGEPLVPAGRATLVRRVA